MIWIIVVLFVLILVTFLQPKNSFKWTYHLIKTLPRDIRWLITYVKMTNWAKECAQNNYTVPGTLLNLVKKHPNKVALYYNNEEWTYTMVENFSNQIAHYFKNEGYTKGNTIALLLENCAAYPVIWLGLSKSGIVTALINTNLLEDSLLHCIKAANCKALIFGSSSATAVKYVEKHMKSVKLYEYNNCQEQETDTKVESVNLQQALQSISNQPGDLKNIFCKDPILYIYTSGTTGLPKAALLSHARLMLAVKSYSRVAKMTSNDVIYTPLPLYHSAGGIVGVCQALLFGVPVVIRKKFSATSYFKDCARYKATIGQYVGEMCRYLLANPEISTEQHKLRVLLGNGLKPQIWQQFVQRFGIKQIIEFYGASEGIANMSNTDGTVGAVGFIPRYLRWAFPITNIRYDENAEAPFRNTDGHCVECRVGEPGLLVAKIDLQNTMFNFEGYTDQKASENRVLRDVFRKGDLYFSSGDILAYDELGYFYFKDRSGDTFRWKSENVSTSEIEVVISKTINLSDVMVYGVQVPFTEGRAGMAAIVDQQKTLNIEALGNMLKMVLPKYAVPVFLRIVNSLPITGTFKLKKVELRNEGFNIYKIEDSLYFYDSEFEKYVPLNKDVYNKIQNGKIRL